MGVAIELREVTFRYTPAPGPDGCIFHALSLRIEQDDFVCIVGRSGVGKTTLLKLIGGLLPLNAGEIKIVGSADGPRPATAFVFQEPALLPWRTALENVMLPIELEASSASRAEAAKALQEVGLRADSEKFPNELSGGMRTRVALARALVVGAPILLMDEPFGNLDEVTRQEIHELVRDIHSQARMTVLLVTHNITEALSLGRRVIVLAGKPARIVRDMKLAGSKWWELRDLIVEDLRHEHCNEGRT